MFSLVFSDSFIVFSSSPTSLLLYGLLKITLIYAVMWSFGNPQVVELRLVDELVTGSTSQAFADADERALAKAEKG